MKFRIKLFLAALLGACTAVTGLTQSQPVVSVAITDVSVLGNGSDEVAIISLTNIGSGYQIVPAVTITPDPSDPNGPSGTNTIVAATATATINLSGNVSSITVTSPGANYTLPPIIAIDPPTGSTVPPPSVTAQATAYLGTHYAQPSQNESFGRAGYTIGITALATGTFPAGGFTYTFYVNGISIGVATPNPPAGTPAIVAWTPPQPGAYFLTVTASDGANSATSLPVRYFATGTAITNPTPNTIVPRGSSVVLQATSMPQPLSGSGGGSGYTSPPTVTIYGGGGSGASYTANLTGDAVTSFTQVSPGSGYTSTPVVVISGGGGSGANAVATINSTTGQVTSVDLTGSDTFVERIDFYSDGVLIGSDSTAPYSVIYTPANTPITHAIQAIAYDNNGNAIPAYYGLDVIGLTMVPPIGTPPVVSISSPANNAVLPVPTATSGAIPIAVSAGSASGLVNKVELYIDGALLADADVTFPYSFSWTPTLVGDYKLIALAYDDKSNVVASTAVTAKIRAQPTVTMVSPVTGSTIGVGTPVSLIAAATDSNVIGGGVSKVQFFVDGAFIGESSAPSGNQYSVSWTPSVAETATITALAFNNFGLTTLSSSISVTVSDGGGGGGGGGPIGNPPTVSVTYPSNGTQLAINQQALITATAADTDGIISSVQFFANSTSLGSTTTYPYATTWTPTSLGTYSITAQATDNDGNVVTSSVVSVTVADPSPNPPTVAITSPANGASIPVGFIQTLTATATDAVSISSVQFYVNGVATGTPDTTFPYEANWTPTSPGTFTIYARAVNASGNQATSNPVTVTVTGGAVPTVALSPTPPASTPINVPITLTASAQAATGFTLTSVSYYANSVLIGTATTYPYAVVWTPIDLGDHVITAIAVDNVGDHATSAPAIVNVVTGSSPTVSLVSPVNGSSSAVGAPITISATATLGAGLITQVDFYANGIQIGTKAISSSGQETGPFFNFDWTPAAAGTYTFTAVITDSAGNRYTTAGSTVTVKANVPPTISLTSPGVGTSYALGSGIIISASAGDTDGTVASVRFYANGQLLTTLTEAPYIFGWIPTAAGSYQITAIAMDNSGGITTSASRTVTITAGTAATVTLANPAVNGTIPVGNDVTLFAAVTGGNGPITSVQFYVNGSLLGSDTTSPYSVSWTPAAPGNYKLIAIATDTAGISASSATMTVSVVANAAPSVSILTPADGATSSAGSPVTLTASASDADGTITSVRYFVNGNTVGTPASTAPYATTWVPTAAGSYTIVAEATDNSGNIVYSSSHTMIVVSNTPPTVSVLTPASGASSVAGVPVSLSALASDSDGTIVSVRFLVNGNVVGVPAIVAPFTTSWTPTAPGSYSIVAEATDNGGGIGTSGVRILTVVSNQAPVVTLTSPSGSVSTTAGLPITLSATALDPDGSVTQVRFLVNGVQVGVPIATAPYTTTWTPMGGGVFTIVAEATDDVGMISSSTGVTAYVTPNLLPSVAITTPANGATVRVNTGTAIIATAADADGTINNVQFFVNGVSVGAISAYPYRVQWTPTSEGIYRVVAIATDNAGASSTSPTVLLNASANAGDAIATGTYVGISEAGNFAVVAATGNLATFIARSTTAGSNHAYFYSDIPVDVIGGFSLTSDAGATLVSGVVSDTGASGTFDSGRLTFIGVDTRLFPAPTPVASGYYTGTVSGHASSSLFAIVGADGSIMLYVADGAFNDAANGKVDATGAFNLVSTRGNRFQGKVDPVTGLLSGTLSGTNGGEFSGAPTTLGGASGKVGGFAREVGSNIVAQNGNTFDQVLLTGTTASITADPGQITRISFVDLNDDIVQVEFSGAGRLALALDNASGPAPAAYYNQPDVSYMRGHANIVITGANETTNVSVFSVGRMTAFNQALFKSTVNYDGVADIGSITILSANGKFGGLRAADADFIASQGMAGVCAPGVQVLGPVFVGDINASNSASPVLLLGSASDVRITGGDLWQANGKAVQISGVTQLKFVNGTNSHGVLLQAQPDRSRIEQNGVDVTAQVVVSP